MGLYHQIFHEIIIDMRRYLTVQIGAYSHVFD